MAQQYGAQVVKVTNDHKYELDEEVLKGVLMREDIQDLPVAVVSVAGVFRGGKSFLLNFFLRYLKASKSAQTSGGWLSLDKSPLNGFSCRGSSTRNTTGILLWTEPYVVEMPDGKKVAVLLMDTQGTFDSTSTLRDCSAIFALSILLSSVQIYNLSSNITENDLQHLQFFSDYGRMGNDENGKPFQVLKILVRDWPYPYEHAFGEIGGKELLEDRLRILPGQPKELKELREYIRTLFEEVSCFLMPHPGLAVTYPTFKGEIDQISPEFLEHLKGLVNSLFSPEKLLLKKINGNVVNAREYFTYFKTYMTIFNSDQVPPVDSIVKATTEAGFLSAVGEARRLYEAGMEKDCGVKKPSVPSSDLEISHNKYLEIARNSFTSKKKMGSKEEADQYLQKLINDLQLRLQDYKAINLSKLQTTVEGARKAYEKSIYNVLGSQLLCVHPADLKQIHNDAVNAAIKIFDAARARVPGKKDDERTLFVKSFEDRETQLRLDNEENNKSASNEIRLKYIEYMQSKCNREPALSSEKFEKEHDIALADALKDFDSRRNLPNSYSEDVYRDNLEQCILESYTSMKLMNKSKNKAKLQAALNAYNDYMGLVWNREQCLHPEDLRHDHNSAKCRALLTFDPKRICSKGFALEDDDHLMLHLTVELRCEDLRSINETSNQRAVHLAYNKYKEIIEDRFGFSWRWLIIIPLLQTAFRSPQYVREARQAALDLFYSKRRPGGLYSSDLYLEQLEAKMPKI